MSNTLMTSISGVRGIVGRDLTPELVARYGAAFGTVVRDGPGDDVFLARDARTSGPMFAAAAAAGLQSVGMSVIDGGLIPTPTAQLAVEYHRAAGGIVITASHNPVEWNALKFIGHDGLFLDQQTTDRLRGVVGAPDLKHSDWSDIGTSRTDDEAIDRHVARVLNLDLVETDRIRERRFTVALDCVRGAGGTIMPALLDLLGCEVVGLDLEPDGRFPRAPEPVPANLRGLSALVRESGADLGMAVDPDVDRLALVDESGIPLGEDYTLALAVRAVLRQKPGPVVVNLSTSLVVDDAARDHNAEVVRAPVGEANVARAMRAAAAAIGGEGNGGVMLAALHLGRDAPVAAGLVLQLLAAEGRSLSALVAATPQYCIVKSRVDRGAQLEPVYAAILEQFPDADVDRQDGLRIAWPDSWLHVRPSGTEPIVRLIAEARDEPAASALIESAKNFFAAQHTP